MSHPPTTSSPANRLAGASSPYLLLHAHNPVDWYPWGEEAIATARREGKPIFLSVGYSTCYWCHVMERESFSNPAIAELMNRRFVNVKLDREQRPDLDEIYMTATQLITQQGGWPNSVFLTPDLEPFYAGTYFPPEDRFGRPGFPSILEGVATAWQNRRAEIEKQANEVAEAMRRYLEMELPPASRPPAAGVAGQAWRQLAGRFDEEWGGFGGAPKFPTPGNLLLLLETADEEPPAEMLRVTLDRMLRGGIYDQAGGGFHRYATDRQWRVPHFEKMLYDNGSLLEIYSRAHARWGDPEHARVARETARFLAREMTGPKGELWSAIDAETGGMEGAYYVWTRPELEEALGAEAASWAAPILGFAGPPFFEDHHYVLHLPEPLAEQAARRRTTREELLAQLAAVRERLVAARARRERPLTDDKVLADWNGLAIAGLAAAAEALGEPAFAGQAARAADFVLANLRNERGRLLHAWREGRGEVPALLADFAFFCHGLLALHRATGEERWLAEAARLADEQEERLGDPRGGWFTAGEGEDLLARSREVFDGATPAGNGIAVLVALELAARTGEERFAARAERALRGFAAVVERDPGAARTLAVAVERYHFRDGRDGNEAVESAKPAAGAPAPPAAEARARVRASLERGPRDEEGWRSFTVSLAVAPGWHVNANPASDPSLEPTTVEGIACTLRDVDYPPPRQRTLAAGGPPVAVWEGDVAIRGHLRADAPRAALRLTFQPCDDSRCLPAVTEELAVGR